MKNMKNMSSLRHITLLNTNPIYTINFELVNSLNGISWFHNRHVAKANDSRSLSDILARCGRTINPLLEKELALPLPSWQEQQECTQSNKQR